MLKHEQEANRVFGEGKAGKAEQALIRALATNKVTLAADQLRGLAINLTWDEFIQLPWDRQQMSMINRLGSILRSRVGR